MPSPYEPIGKEQRDAAREMAAEYHRGRTNPDGPYKGTTILERTTGGPTEADLHRLEASLRKPNKVTASEAERYTKTYKRKLTPSQQTFLDQLLSGDTLIHAFEVAYPNDKSTYRSKSTSAWHLSKHPVIVAAMSKQALAIKGKSQMNAQAIREYVIERLLHESQNAFTDGTRVRALELLGKVAEVGMFVTRTETTSITVPPSELQATLLAKLKAFFDQANNPALPLATQTDRRQGLTIEQDTEDAVEVNATVRQSPASEAQPSPPSEDEGAGSALSSSAPPLPDPLDAP